MDKWRKEGRMQIATLPNKFGELLRAAEERFHTPLGTVRYTIMRDTQIYVSFLLID